MHMDCYKYAFPLCYKIYYKFDENSSVEKPCYQNAHRGNINILEYAHILAVNHLLPCVSLMKAAPE